MKPIHLTSRSGKILKDVMSEVDFRFKEYCSTQCVICHLAYHTTAIPYDLKWRKIRLFILEIRNKTPQRL